MVLIAVRLQISLKSDLGSVGRASTVALSHSFDIYLSLSLSQTKCRWKDISHRDFIQTKPLWQPSQAMTSVVGSYLYFDLFQMEQIKV